MGIGDSIFDTTSTASLVDALGAAEDPQDVQQQLFRRLAATTRSDVPSLIAFLERERPEITDEMLARITCPVLVIIGERDGPAPDRLVAGLADATLVTLPGVDHFSTPQDFGAIDATMRFFGLA
jgi:pimeloyl-ACP methyl ester carboxylesterase